MKFKKNVCAASIVALGLVAGSAHAISFVSSGDWTSVAEGNGSVGNINGIGTNRVSWGNPFGDVNPGESAYVFDGKNPGDAPLDNTLFPVGDFTHENFTIYLPSITGANLEMDLTFAGNPLQTFNFLFDHLETPNSQVPCAAGGPNPCQDLVTIPDASATETVTIGGKDYFLFIEGFSQDNGATIESEFLTLEGQENKATLYARLKEVPPVDVPLPSALALLGLGLLGFGVRRKSPSGIAA